MPTQIFSENGFLNMGGMGCLATLEEYDAAPRDIGSIFEALKEGESIQLKEGVFVLDEDLDPIRVKERNEYWRQPFSLLNDDEEYIPQYYPINSSSQRRAWYHQSGYIVYFNRGKISYSNTRHSRSDFDWIAKRDHLLSKKFAISLGLAKELEEECAKQTALEQRYALECEARIREQCELARLMDLPVCYDIADLRVSGLYTVRAYFVSPRGGEFEFSAHSAPWAEKRSSWSLWTGQPSKEEKESCLAFLAWRDSLPKLGEEFPSALEMWKHWAC